jgi:hypothetical protein
MSLFHLVPRSASAAAEHATSTLMSTVVGDGTHRPISSTLTSSLHGVSNVG